MKYLIIMLIFSSDLFADGFAEMKCEKVARSIERCENFEAVCYVLSARPGIATVAIECSIKSFTQGLLDEKREQHLKKKAGK